MTFIISILKLIICFKVDDKRYVYLNTFFLSWQAVFHTIIKAGDHEHLKGEDGWVHVHLHPRRWQSKLTASTV